MKKYILILLTILFSAMFVYADIYVQTDKGQKIYPDDSTLNINAAKNIKIKFYNADLFIPKGEKVSIKFLIEDERPYIYLTGDTFTNVRIGADKFTALEQSIFKVDVLSADAAMLKGQISVKRKDKKEFLLGSHSVYIADIVPSDTGL